LAPGLTTGHPGALDGSNHSPNIGTLPAGPGQPNLPGVAQLASVQAPPASDLSRQIAAQIMTVAADRPGRTRIEIRLDPPEMGRIEVALDISDQRLRATLHADRAGTADILRRHGDLLIQDMRESGFVDIDLQFAGRDDRSAPSDTGATQAPKNGDTGEAAERPGQQHGSAMPVGTLRAGLDLRF